MSHARRKAFVLKALSDYWQNDTSLPKEPINDITKHLRLLLSEPVKESSCSNKELCMAQFFRKWFLGYGFLLNLVTIYNI